MSLTIQKVLLRAAELRVSSDSWQIDTELLLAEAMMTRREYLRTWPEREVDPAALQIFETLFARRVRGEPLAYILGRKDFWDFQLQVNSHVLIPRPETELLVESALNLVGTQGAKAEQLVDLGSGSGAIAIALARELPGCKVLAVDRSADALALASNNAARLGAANIRFQAGCWCQGLTPHSADMIVTNPPYVAINDAHLQQGDLRFEPTMALVAPDAGLGDIKTIIEQSRTVLRNSGWLLLEHGYLQGSEVRDLLAQWGYRKVESRQDLAGHDRVTLGQWVSG